MQVRTSHITRIFAAITLVPVGLLFAASVYGGAWIWAALGYMTVLTYALDTLVAVATDPEVPEAEFPAANTLSVVLALAHFALLAAAVIALAGAQFGPWEKAGIFLASGLFFGQVSNSNAHELIHRPSKALRLLGTWVYISLLFGHHASAHPKVHHPNVATPYDPNSAPSGMSYYRFLPRAWLGSFARGFAAETRQRKRHRKGLHPYALYIGGAVGLLAASFAIGGPAALAAHVALAGHATSQLLLSDYVQHYGLRRARDANGRYAPQSAVHSWNARQWFSGFLMLNAPRHSDHHIHPMTPYPALDLTPDMPMLPRSLPVMATLALVPPLWRRVMDPRAAKWQARENPPQ